MGVAVRVIPCLDVAEGRVVKGVNFLNLKDAGDPVELARRQWPTRRGRRFRPLPGSRRGGRGTLLDVVRRTAEEVFVPLTVGGGVRSVEDVRLLLEAGADKASVNSAAVADPGLISAIADAFGSQVLVLSLDSRRNPRAGTPSGFEVTTHAGRRGTGVDAVEWAARAERLGAGEILVNSMDADGTTGGFDLEMTAAVKDAVGVPVVASGGAGTAGDFAAAARCGADAVLAASVFHFGRLTIPEVKDAMRQAGVPVR